MLPIQKKLIKFNYSSGNKPTYLVIHDTGNTGSGANALAHYNYFNGGDRQASAHYFVDSSNIIQTVEHSNASWHCGDGGGKYGITNYNSIGIEICINSDGNYSQAVSNAVELTKYLMNSLSIPANRVVRHYDASRKNCPGSMSANNWAAWNNFKSRISSGGGDGTIYRVQVGAFSVKANADKLASELKGKGIDCMVVSSGSYYKVQCGAYSVRANADAQVSKLKSLGYEAIVVTA